MTNLYEKLAEEERPEEFQKAPTFTHNGDINAGYLIMRIDKGIRKRIRLIDTPKGRFWRKVY